MANVVMTFTGHSFRSITNMRGSGHWPGSAKRMAESQYVVCVRNRRMPWAAKDYPHGTAFLVGRVVGTVDSDLPDRTIIRFDRYAHIRVSDAWKLCTSGQRYPVAFLNSEEVEHHLGFSFEALDWKDLPAPDEADALLESEANAAGSVELSTQSIDEVGSEIVSMTVEQAKEALALHFNVTPDRIDITVRF